MSKLLEETKPQRIAERKKKKAYALFCRVFAPLIVIGLIILGWKMYINIGEIAEWRFPDPTIVLTNMVTGFADFLPHIIRTFTTILIGWIIAICIGLLLAVLIVNFPKLGELLTPYINMICTLPIITLVPMMYVLMGVGREVIIIAVILQSFAIMNMNSVTGFLNVPIMRTELMLSLRANRIQTFFRCLLPSALPNIFTGMKLSAIFATMACISSELCGSMVGLGAYLLTAKQFMKTSVVFGCIFFVMIIGLLFYIGLSLLESKLVNWKE